MGIELYRSRFTPGVSAGDILLEVGELIDYELLNGTVIQAKITSKRMTHAKCEPHLGYEAIDLRDQKRFFADGRRIVNWDGRVPT